MARVKIELDRNQVEAILGFEDVRKRFAKAQVRQPQPELPTFSAADLGIAAVSTAASADEMPVLDVSQLQISSVEDD
ncbi:MAG: hypothetical protein U0610_11410 [bacterium]